MKKFTAMLLSTVFCLSLLAGCGGNNTAEKPAESGELKELDVVLDWYPMHSTLSCTRPLKRATTPRRA